MARLETSSAVWLAVLGLGLLAIVGIGGYAGFRLVSDAPAPTTAPATRAAAAPPTTAAAAPPRGSSDLPAPAYIAHDRQRTADEAYRDLWAAIGRNDAAVAAKYLPAAKLQRMTSGREVLDDFLGLSPVENVQVVKTTARGDKAVLFVKASSPSITDDKGRPAPIDVVARMAREDGHWKVESQMWLVSTPPEEHQQEALQWLAGRAAPEPVAVADGPPPQGALELRDAVKHADVQEVRRLLAAGVSARTRTESGSRTLLDEACLALGGSPEHEQVAIMLVQAGAELETQTLNGLTPLMHAAVFCKPRLLAALIAAGAKLDARNARGATALQEAGGCPLAAQQLRAAGAR